LIGNGKLALPSSYRNPAAAGTNATTTVSIVIRIPLCVDAEVRERAGLIEVLDTLVIGTRERLSDNYVGVYLQGSLATGDFDNHSDVDFLVVTETQPAEQEISELQDFHRDLFTHPCYWAQHLEGSYVPRRALAQLPPPRRNLLYLDHGSTTFEMSNHDHYLAVLWILRERGVILDGPSTDTLVPPIPIDALRAEVRATMEGWGRMILRDQAEVAARWRQAFAVLSYCRMAETLNTGEVHSKRHGAEWAKTRMDASWVDLIDRAIVERAHPVEELLMPADPLAKKDTQSFIAYVLEQEI
jgi:hypothetical protein